MNIPIAVLTAFAFISLPALAESPSLESTIPTLLLGLLFVIFLIFVVAGIVKRTSLSSLGVSGLKVVTMLPLSTREKLVVVDVDGQQILLGVTQNNINLLKELDKPLPTANKIDINQSFKKIFEQVKQRD